MVSAEEINDLYNKLLGRDYDSSKVQKLIRNKFSLSRIEKSILHSNEYKERRNVIFNFDKWVEFGERYTYVLKDKEFTEPPVTSNNNLVFIDFRYLDNMEFVIRNALLRLNGTFMVTFVCGLANYDDVKILCSEISQNIKVVKLDEHVNNNIDYNKLLLSPNFWKMLDGEKILIHQFDAFISKNNVEEFLGYDYLGPPCYYGGEELIYNGGFSIRTKQVMIDLLETHKPKDISEDIFFTRNIEINKEVSTKFAFQEEETDAFGCHQMWRVREFSHSEFYDKLKYEKSDIHKYPNLFHKFVLGIRNPYDPIKYEIKQQYFEQKELVAHLHCYDIEKFDEFYGYKIEEIVKYYFTIVTFSKGNYKGGIDNVVILKHENRGGDIGGKFVCIKYLRDIKYEYTNILMLHSKTDKMKRKMYYDPFLQDISRTIKEINKDYGCYVPEIILNSNIEMIYPNRKLSCNIIKRDWDRNSLYMVEIEKYMNIPDFSYTFPEGNNYILHKTVAEELYTDLKIYNSLNNRENFDYLWTKTYYKLNKECEEVYRDWKDKNLHGNNFSLNKGWNGLADCMIEHIFERLIFGISKKNNLRINILYSKFSEQIDSFIFNNNISNLKPLPITVMACHTNSEIKIKAILNNIKYISKFSNIIHIVNSSEYSGLIEKYLDKNIYVINDNLTKEDVEIYTSLYPDLKNCNLSYQECKNHWRTNGKRENRYIEGKALIYISYIPNDIFVCQGKWLSVLKNINIDNFFILTNDSFFIINDNILKIKDIHYSQNYEMISVVDSNEVKHHHMDFFRYYNPYGISKLKSFYETNIINCKNFYDIIKNIEMDSTYITEKRLQLYEMKKDYGKNLHFDDKEYEKYLEDGYPIIKIKKILFNKYDGFPRDFKADEYKRLHIDLVHMENTEAEQHFINHGFGEGRPYKKNQKTVLPKYLDKYVTSLGLQKIR